MNEIEDDDWISVDNYSIQIVSTEQIKKMSKEKRQEIAKKIWNII